MKLKRLRDIIMKVALVQLNQVASLTHSLPAKANKMIYQHTTT